MTRMGWVREAHIGVQSMSNDRVDKLVDAKQVAELWGLKPATIRKMTYRGEIPCVRITGRRCVRYRLSTIMKLIEMRSQPMRGGER